MFRQCTSHQYISIGLTRALAHAFLDVYLSCLTRGVYRQNKSAPSHRVAEAAHRLAQRVPLAQSQLSTHSGEAELSSTIVEFSIVVGTVVDLASETPV